MRVEQVFNYSVLVIIIIIVMTVKFFLNQLARTSYIYYNNIFQYLQDVIKGLR